MRNNESEFLNERSELHFPRPSRALLIVQMEVRLGDMVRMQAVRVGEIIALADAAVDDKVADMDAFGPCFAPARAVRTYPSRTPTN